jgi:hypothetical protein
MLIVGKGRMSVLILKYRSGEEKKRVTVYFSTETRQKSNLWPLIQTSRNTLGMCRNLVVA